MKNVVRLTGSTILYVTIKKKKNQSTCTKIKVIYTKYLMLCCFGTDYLAEEHYYTDPAV